MLEAGISSKEIEKIENEYNVLFPNDYKAFLTLYNGGDIFIPGGIEFSRIYIEGDVRENVSYLQDSLSHKFSKTMPNLPDNFLEIANDGEGNPIGLLLSDNPSLSPKIIKWDLDEAEPMLEFDNLISWLKYELELGKELFEDSRKL